MITRGHEQAFGLEQFTLLIATEARRLRSLLTTKARRTRRKAGNDEGLSSCPLCLCGSIFNHEAQSTRRRNALDRINKMNGINNGFHTSCKSCKSCLRILLGELCVSVVISLIALRMSFRLFLGEKKLKQWAQRAVDLGAARAGGL